MDQYSNRIVVMHWLTLVLMIAAWYLGEEVHDARKAEAGATIAGYVAHSVAGGAVLLLTLLRLAFRKADGVPPPMGQSAMDKVATGVHHTLYLLLFLLPISGMMQVLTSDVGKAIMAGDAALLPHKFSGVVAHEVHEVLVNVIILMIGVHVLGALKHHFVLKDGLLKRMWFK